MPLAYIYSRVSTKRQIDGLGLKRQAEDREKWIAAHSELNLTVVQNYADLGLSARGKAQTEGKLSLIIKAIHSGKIPKGSYLIVDSLDRISREELLDAYYLILTIVRAGVVIVTTGDGMMYDRADRERMMFGLLISLVIVARSSNESEVKSDRGLKNWNMKRAVAATGTPITGMTPAWITLDKDQNKLTLNEHAATVRRIFELSSQGFGTGLIVQTLNKESRTPMAAERRKDGGKWSRRYISLILENRAVLGEFQPGMKNHGIADHRQIVGDAIPDYYPKVCDDIDSLWAKVQAIRAGRKDVDTRNRRGDFTNLFAGLCRCASCGTSMTINHRQAPSKISYLRCPEHFMTKTCNSGESYRYDLLETGILDQLDSLLKIESCTTNAVGGFENDLATERHTVERLNRAISNLLDDAEANGISEVRERLQKRREEKAGAEKRIANLENKITVERQSLPAKNYILAIADKRAGAISDDIDVRTAARAEIKTHLIRLITKIEFKPNKLVTVDFKVDGDHAYQLDLVIKPEAVGKSTVSSESGAETLSAIRWRNPPGSMATARRLAAKDQAKAS
jgi:DNA invertase Pin-like site-specific DNA recombinase